MNEQRYMISDASKQLHVEAHVLRYWEDELKMDIPRTELGHRYYTRLHLLAFERIKQLKEAGYQLKAIKLILPKLTELDDEEFEFISLVADEMNRRACEYEDDTPETSEIGNPAESASLDPTENLTVSIPADISENQTETAESLQTAMTCPCVHTESNNLNITEDKPADTVSQLPSNIITLNRTPAELNHEERLAQFQNVMTGVVSNALQMQAKQFGNLLSDQISEKLLREMDYLLRLRQEQEELRFQQLDETIRSHQKSIQEVAASRAPGKKKHRR